MPIERVGTGPILRYMGYVREDLAGKDQTVEGVAIEPVGDQKIRSGWR
jgi:hypothetical protein